MATSPNFNWPEPDNTDLVKNGALAIRTAVDAIDSSLVDLKGGTTGQVLAKASNTDMDFVWAADAGAPESLGFAAGKNKVINGDFRINQRNYTTGTLGSTYGFDRFKGDWSGGVTYSAETFTAGTAPVSGYEAINFARLVTSGQSNANTYTFFYTPIEDVRTFAGQTMTYSFWAKAATGTPKVFVEFDQQFGSGGSARVLTAGSSVTLSTSWARYSLTFTVPSIAGKTIGTSSYVALNMWVSAGTDFNARTGSLGIQSNTFDFWGVQAENGSVATAFQTATGTIQGEFAACRYYYRRATADATSLYQPMTGTGFAATTTDISYPILFDTPMRATPTSIEYANLRNSDGINAPVVNSVTLNSLVSNRNAIYVLVGTASATQFRPYALQANNSATAFLGWSAEL